MRNILVAVDFSDVTSAVIEAACEQANNSEAKLRVIHVLPPDPSFVGYDIGPINEIEFRQTTVDTKTGQLNAIVDKMKERGFDAEADLPEGPDVETILKQVNDNEIDMIVVGSHGHGALFNLVAGSVTQGLLHKAKVPVLVIPSQRA